MDRTDQRESDHAGDHVDQLRAQWARACPQIDTGPMDVVGRINRLAILFGNPITKMMVEHGLERGEFDVLAALRRAGEPSELSPTQLYRSLMLSSGGLTNRLKRLAAKGMIDRRADPNDGRSDLVCLTEMGRDAVDAAFHADMALEAELIAGVSDERRTELAALLRTLCQTLEDDQGTADE